jgi:hypothetical protein
MLHSPPARPNCGFHARAVPDRPGPRRSLSSNYLARWPCTAARLDPLPSSPTREITHCTVAPRVGFFPNGLTVHGGGAEISPLRWSTSAMSAFSKGARTGSPLPPYPPTFVTQLPLCQFAIDTERKGERETFVAATTVVGRRSIIGLSGVAGTSGLPWLASVGGGRERFPSVGS